MDWGVFIVFLGATAAAAATGSLFPPGDWYARLAKPRWTPPDWLFPVAWSVLYVSAAVAAARVAGMEGSGLAMAFWALQIALNTLWSPVFFGLRRIRTALWVLAALWLAVLGTLLALWPLDRIAAALMVPYLAWVSVAGALNLAVLRLNPDADALPVR